LRYTLESIPDFLHVLDPHAKILYASWSCKTITGHEPTGIQGSSVINFIHPDDKDIFIKELDNARACNISVRFFYRFRNADEEWVIFESRIQWYCSNKPNRIILPQSSIDDQGFIVVARPYRNKTTIMFDSFLELKIENEKLAKRIAELKREEQEDEAEYFDIIKEEEMSGEGEEEGETADGVNEESPNFGAKKAGLVTRGDAGIPLPTSYFGNDSMSKKKVKKRKVLGTPQLQICVACGVVDSPEWRRGPNGPKTLCNACGRKFDWFK
jgi:PAS domain S-box-containing protein